MPIPWKFFWLPALGILSVVLVLAACGSDEPELPDTTAASVLAYLDEVDYQNNDDWKLWPGVGEKYEGSDPHGMLLTSYLNPSAFEALDEVLAGSAAMPDGAIIVKENYTPEGNFDANTVMYKKSGYNPEHNDWFWLKVGADGAVQVEGMGKGCQDCHSDVKSTDYVFGPQQ